MASYKLGDPLLTVKREKAIEQITGQMISGKDFITGERTDEHSFNKWHYYNKELLRGLFTGNKYLIEYGNCFRKGRDNFGRKTAGGDRTVPWSPKDRALAGIQNLERLIDRIGLIPEAPDGTSQSRPAVESKPGRRRAR
jgi:hypothetical protein